MVHALGFDARRTAFVVALRTCDTSCQDLFLSLGDKGFVLAVRSRHDAQFFCQLEGLIKFAIVDSEGALVGEENLERLNALRHDFAKLRGGAIVEFGHTHVERIVTCGLAAGLAFPYFESLAWLHGSRWTAHVEDRRCSANESRLGPGFVVVLCIGTHEGEVNMRVRVNESGEDVLSRGVDDFRAGRGIYLAVDARDGFVLTPDVGDIVRVAGYDFAVFDQEAHGFAFTEDNEENKGLFC